MTRAWIAAAPRRAGRQRNIDQGAGQILDALRTDQKWSVFSCHRQSSREAKTNLMHWVEVGPERATRMTR